MQCPRCHSERIQRDYDDAIIFLRAVGMHKLLCTNCGFVFKGFDPQGKFQRGSAESPRPKTTAKQVPNRRRGPRFNTHLPATISVIEGDAQEGTASYSQPSRGHCETISSYGMLLTLVGTRFAEGELSRRGRLLLVRIDLPNGPVEAVVAIVTHERKTDGQKQWALGVKIHQMSDADRELLANYVERRSREANQGRGERG